jgi:predicted DNA-binding transcriptional regulator YafY
MPKNKDAFIRYDIIDSELRKGLLVKTKSLSKLCSDRLGKTITNRTIQKDIRDMMEDSGLEFYAQIKYNTFKKAHYYDKDTPPIFPAISLNEEEIDALLFYSKALYHYKNYSIFNNISAAIDKVLEKSNISSTLLETFRRRSIFEAEKSIAIKGNELIKEVLSALLNCKKIEFDYVKFDGNQSHRVFTPYLLKEDKQMWYVLGVLDGKEYPSTFAIDRIKNMQITNTPYQPVEFDSENYFKHSFGITVPSGKPIKIILSFSPWQANYLRALKIHSTQEVIIDSDIEFRISVIIKPAYEFYSKILSYGADVQVISPKKVANEIEKMLSDTIKRYKNK